MSVPRDFGFGDEAVMLRDAARRFFQANMPADRLHRLVAADADPGRTPGCAWEPELWRQMAELGWTGVAVPELAVIGNGEKRSVFVLEPGDKVKAVQVKTGVRDNGLVEVIGLPAGAKVISEGALKLSDGMKVRLPKPPKPGGKPSGKPAGGAAQS